MRGILGLVKNGVPWEVAITLDYTTQMAWNIALGEIESGQKFDFDRMSWPDK